MRLALFSEGYFPEISGVTTSLHQRLQYLSAWGHSVRLYVPDYAPLASLYPNYRDYVGEILPNITVRPFPSRPYYVNYTRDPVPFSLGPLHAEIEQLRPDLIHAECPERLFMGFLGRPGIAVARKLRIPATAIYHTNYLAYIPDYKKQVRWLGLPGMDALLRKLVVSVYNSYDVTMVATPAIRDALVAHGVRNTCLQSFYGVHIDIFRPPPVPAPPDQPARVLFIGRMSADKQIDALLAALALVRKSCPDSPFVLLGGGPEEDKVRAWLQTHGPGEHIGRVPYAELPPYYWRGDVFVTACHKETRPLTVSEAMASGLPVVAPAGGGLPDMIEHGQTGLLVPPDDVRALADAVIRLLRSPAERRAMGQRARASVESYGWEAGTRAMLQIWEQLRAPPARA
jgi:glycosyltransferase involved in cell wall biosynthesis